MEKIIKELDDQRRSFLRSAKTNSESDNYSKSVEHYNVAIGLMLAITKLREHTEKVTA
jgi:hypothetical protein